MKKMVVTFILLYCFFINTVFAESLILEYDGGTHNYTGDVYALTVNGKTLTNLPLNPIIFNDRAVVPVREVFEELGAKVDYKQSNNTVTVKYKQKTVELQIGMNTALVNGIRKTIPDGVGVKLIGKQGEYPKTMVPVRFISESVGLVVGYDGVNKVISISEKSPRPSANPTSSPEPTPTPTAKPTATPTVKPTATPTTKPTAAPARLTKLTTSQSGDVVTVKITASASVSKISAVTKTAQGVVYADIFGTQNTLASSTAVNLGVVKTVRVGQHTDYTRIAIDTEGVEKYTVALSSDKKTVTFSLSGNKNANMTTAPTATAKPTSTPTVKPTSAPTQTPTPTPTPEPMKYSTKKIVVLDAGHGGSDPGASANVMTDEEKEEYEKALASEEDIISTMSPGTGKKINEKDVALAVVKKVKQNLEDNGIEVILTRSGDTYPTLDSRPELANTKGAVIFVSVHLNSTVSSVTAASGVEVYYSTQNNDNTLGVTSKKLADKILECVIDSTDARSRGVKEGNLLVNRKCRMPSALVEIGFMNNPYELDKMITDKYQDKVAAGIARGIISIYNSVKIPKDKELK